MPTVRISISLDAVDDARLLQWLDKQSNASEAVRKALYAYIDRPSHSDLAARLEQLLELVRRMKVVEASEKKPETEDGEPIQARKGLEAMKRRFKDGGHS